MALKAGYYGIKKKMVNKLTKLTGIYSIGSGLNLSNAGSLSVKSATTSQKGIVQLDEVPTDESNNVPTSNGVYDALQEKVSWDEQAVLGAKNLLPNKAVSKTEDGITFTVNTDKSVTTDTDTTTTRDWYYTITDTFTLKAGSYILSSGSVNADIFMQLTNPAGTTEIVNTHNIAEKSFTLANDTEVIARIRYYNNKTIDNVTIYPMIRIATDTDSTYAPYAMTNRELTEKVNDLIMVRTSLSFSNESLPQGAFELGVTLSGIPDGFIPFAVVGYNIGRINGMNITGIEVSITDSKVYLRGYAQSAISNLNGAFRLLSIKNGMIKLL